MKRNATEIVSQMTLEEKARLCSGRDFWNTAEIQRLGIKSIMMTDGPHGLRKQSGFADHLGINKSNPATCFPTGAALASSWDRKLIENVGKTIGVECQSENVGIVLGPAANIKRSPLCGRNFEYLSEDPYLTGEMAAHHIKGVQSQGVGTSIKHFAANNQEFRRMYINAKVDERTLHEIYLAGFESAVKQSQPWTVMCAYNKLNGTYCSENKYLLNDVLREKWGFDGAVISDWGAVNEITDSIAAGLDLEMPSSHGAGEKKIVEAVESGRLSEEALNRTVERLLKVIFKAFDNQKGNVTYDISQHHKLARKAASECAVLLKNEGNILPLKKRGKIAVIGEFAVNPRYQGGGSSHINPHKIDSPLDEIKKLAGEKADILFAQGYKLGNEAALMDDNRLSDESSNPNYKLIDEAARFAESSDVAVVFAGLPASFESEGYDRQHMSMPDGHNELIKAIAEVQKNLVVVLSNGSPVEMPWIQNAKGVLECYLGGEAVGGAIADLLFGEANPCGRLAETFPQKLSDTPCYLFFPGDEKNSEYCEGIFVGYRYCDAKGIKLLFPFGYGLSYTQFAYSDMRCDKISIAENDTIKVSVKVKNIGNVAGKEVVQLYISDMAGSVLRPVKELKGFEKIELQPHEEKTVVFELGKRAFAFYDTEISDWSVETGSFEILVGRSAEEILLRQEVTVHSAEKKQNYTINTTFGELFEDAEATDRVKAFLKDI
jgi:beta-glucosidase